MSIANRLFASFISVFASVPACGDDPETAGDADASDTDATVGGDATSGSDGTGGGDGVTTEAPRWDDPAWTEPAAPAAAVVDGHVAAVRAAAAATLDADDLATLETEAIARTPEAAQGYLSGLYLDAARVILADATETSAHAGPWIGLAALELVDGGDAARAADLSRHALAMLDGVEPTRLTYTRLRASAWNNLGLALLRMGEAAGAVHAYREATAILPDDAHYRTGLAAALMKAELPVPALLEATRATSLEVLDDPSLANDPGRATPARAWKEHITGKLKAGIALPPNATPPEPAADGAAPVFPAAGSSWLGFHILEAHDDGSFLVAEPPFEAHGTGHLGAALPECEQISDTNLVLSCPAQPSGQWFIVGLLGPHVEPRVNEPGLDCSNIFTRTFDPEPRDVLVGPPAQPTLTSQVGFLSAAIGNELIAIESSFAVPNGNADTIERCSDFGGVVSGYDRAFERVTQSCSCNCEEDAECPPCWSDYLAACKALFDTSSALVTREITRAYEDDAVHQQNLARWLPMLISMTPYQIGKTSCDASCATIVSLHPAWIWASRIGGRTPSFLALQTTYPPAKYLQCVRAAPPTCSGPPEDLPGEAKDVPCLCLGAGLFSTCIKGDGSLEVKAAAVLAVGGQVNLKEGLSSLRLGVGADIGVNLGPVAFGVSQMSWWDASTNTWKEGGVEFDVGVAGPSGSGIKGAPGVCDGWQADAPEREGAPEGMAIEATSDGPP